MRVLFVNTTCGRASYGKICGELASTYMVDGNEIWCRQMYYTIEE